MRVQMRKSKSLLMRSRMKDLSTFRWPATARLSRMLRSATLLSAIALAMVSGCSTPHASLIFTAPTEATAGTPFTVTVTAVYEGERDTSINSPITFTSSDPDAVLPSLYRFTSADAGSHTWVNGFTLMTPGSQTISATIYDAIGINGSATITVSP